MKKINSVNKYLVEINDNNYRDIKGIDIAAKGEEFNSQGAAVIFSLKLLRMWQFKNNPICNNKKPFDAISEQRQGIYNRKNKLLKDMGIKCDFI